MLRADPQYMPDVGHLCLHVEAIGLRAARGDVDQPCKHANGRGLARSVVAQQSEDLALVHLHREVFDGHFATGVGLEHIADDQGLVLGLELVQLLIAFFDAAALLLVHDLVLWVLFQQLLAIMMRAFASPEEIQEEQRVLLAPELIREDLVEVDRQHKPDDDVDDQTGEGSGHAVVVVQLARVLEVDPLALVLEQKDVVHGETDGGMRRDGRLVLDALCQRVLPYEHSHQVEDQEIHEGGHHSDLHLGEEDAHEHGLRDQHHSEQEEEQEQEEPVGGLEDSCFEDRGEEHRDDRVYCAVL